MIFDIDLVSITIVWRSDVRQGNYFMLSITVFFIVERYFQSFKMTWIHFQWYFAASFSRIVHHRACIRFKYSSSGLLNKEYISEKKKKEINDLKIIKFNFLSNQTMSLKRLFLIFQNYYNFSFFFPFLFSSIKFIFFSEILLFPNKIIRSTEELFTIAAS